MRPIDEWFERYGQSHQHPSNKALHWICIPLIVWSILALLWSAPVPSALSDLSPALNWATAFLLATLAYYFALSIPLAMGMTLAMGALWLLTWWLAGRTPLWPIALPVFVLAWIGQLMGHKVEGARPSFLEDLQFLLIGPLWLLGSVYRTLGLPYSPPTR